MATRLTLALLSSLVSVLLVSAEGLSLKVSGPSQVDDVASLTITATLTNMGASALRIVNDPRSALSTRQTNTFVITHESGANPTFTGMKVKYGLDLAAQKGAVTTLEPGQSIDTTHTLAGVYNFTNSGPGSYEIAPSTLFHTVSESGIPEDIHASLQNSHTVTITDSARLAVTREPSQRKRDATLRRGILMKRASFSSCSSSEESQVNTATSGAVSYVAGALSYLQAHTSSTTRFTTWFGTYTSAHHTTVTNHYTSLSASGSYTSWTYDCACADGDDNTYAYTFPSIFGEIFLCPVFWEAPQTGTDSKAGTLVHESTHFTRTAGTQDYAYGQTACKSLAKSNSAEAIENADSHEYFAENNPALS